jgi:fructose-specific phosphotransferase system IIC component
MTIIELGFFMTPVFGAVGGCMAARGSSASTTVSALVVGALLGAGLLSLMRLTFRVLPSRFNSTRPGWLGPLLAVFVLPIALPIIACFLSHAIVSAGLHL